MTKKQTEQEKIISDAAELILQTIHIAATRIADKYERQLMTEVMTRIQAQLEANKEVNNAMSRVLNDKLNKLSQ